MGATDPGPYRPKGSRLRMSRIAPKTRRRIQEWFGGPPPTAPATRGGGGLTARLLGGDRMAKAAEKRRSQARQARGIREAGLKRRTIYRSSKRRPNADRGVIPGHPSGS